MSRLRFWFKSWWQSYVVFGLGLELVVGWPWFDVRGTLAFLRFTAILDFEDYEDYIQIDLPFYHFEFGLTRLTKEPADE